MAAPYEINNNGLGARPVNDLGARTATPTAEHKDIGVAAPKVAGVTYPHSAALTVKLRVHDDSMVVCDTCGATVLQKTLLFRTTLCPECGGMYRLISPPMR